VDPDELDYFKLLARRAISRYKDMVSGGGGGGGGGSRSGRGRRGERRGGMVVVLVVLVVLVVVVIVVATRAFVMNGNNASSPLQRGCHPLSSLNAGSIDHIGGNRRGDSSGGKDHSRRSSSSSSPSPLPPHSLHAPPLTDKPLLA